MYRPGYFLCAAQDENHVKKKTFTYSEKSAKKRAEFFGQIAQIDPETIVYVDESGVNKFYQREYARAPIGQKIEDVRRGKKYRRTNVIAGYCNGEVLGSHCYLCNTNGDFFELWFEKFLLPEVPVGYTIVMDNASFHRKKKLQKLAEKYGIRLIFLPPYSPDLNPIEKLRANMKRALRDLVRKFRTGFVPDFV